MTKKCTVVTIVTHPAETLEYIEKLEAELAEKNRILAELAAIIDSYKPNNIDG